MRSFRIFISCLLIIALPLQALAAVGTFACEGHGEPTSLEQPLDNLHQHHAGMDHESDTQNNTSDQDCECVSCSPASHTQLQSSQASMPDNLPLTFSISLFAGRSPDGLFRPPI
ncbi:MAG: hypothetical protein OEU86_07705 [Gammaproteobacteria bacterium]|nr:hypothetical protein [Gammaproteobacteria bacterium]